MRPGCRPCFRSPVDVGVVPAHDAIAGECPGDGIVCGGDVVVRKPGWLNWTIASSVDVRGDGRQA